MSDLNIDNRIDFLFFFDVTDGNPNGDPDAGNSPRFDHETGHGLVSDVALKRKVRDFVAAAKGSTPGYEIYIKLHSCLYDQREPAYQKLKLTQKDFEKLKGDEKAKKVGEARAWMCQNYFDVRAFGAVMSVKEFNCGQVRGPLQFTFSRSLDPIVELEQAIVRKAVEKNDAEKQLQGKGENPGGQITGTIGRKSLVPYALFKSKIFFNPKFAADTGFSNDDLALFLAALNGMFENDRSASRGDMSACKLFAFQHSSPLGNAPAARLFERIRAQLKPELRNERRPARQLGDYDFHIDRENLPNGVTLHELL